MLPLGVKIRLLRPEAAVPRYATADAAACDLTAAISSPLAVPAHGSLSVPCGIAVSMEESGYFALICARSGLAFRHGISLVNGVGVIDADYRGEIAVGLRNDSDEDYLVQPGERIAQMLFLPVRAASFTVVDTLDETARGEGGFGSSGRL